MSFYIISSIIVLLISILLLRNLYVNKGTYRSPELVRVKFPRWVWLLTLIPIINIIVVTALFVYVCISVVDEGYVLKGPIGKLASFLSKEV